MKAKLLLIIFGLTLTFTACKNDVRHKAVIYKTKKHHVVMKDDQGKWWEYTLKNLDIDFDIPFNAHGEMILPRGGSWRMATIEEEDEVTLEGQATNAEETTVDEATADDGASSPDGAGDVGGDSGGDGGAGGDGGGGDGGGGDGD
jgi:uncharacterized membrane protein YgcG